MNPSHSLSTFAFCICGLITVSSNAQHFAPPPSPDFSGGMLSGEPCGFIPRPTTSFGSAVLDGWVYVMGGYHGRPHDYNALGQSKDFYRVNSRNTSHVEMLPNQMGMQSCPLESWEGKVIRTGGLVARNSPEEPTILESLRSVQWFDASSMKWSDLPSLPAGRSSHDTAVVGSHLYVIGGWDIQSEADSRSWHKNMMRLDLRDPDAGWTALEMPFEKRALAAVSVQEKILVIGGMTSSGISKSVHLYDPSGDSWEELTDYPGQSFGIAADGYAGQVVATGSDGAVFQWEEATRQWDKIGYLTFPRFFHQVAFDEAGDAMVFGGISGGTRPSHIEKVRVASADQAPTVVQQWSLPSPSDSKNRQAIFVKGASLYTFGGNNSTGQHDFQPENFLSEGHQLNLASLRWRKRSDYPMRRQSSQSFLVDSKSGFALGGFGHDGESARTQPEGYTYNFKSDEWTRTGPHFQEPRSQFGLTEHDGEFWVFGGLDYDSTRDRSDHFRHLSEVVHAPIGDEEARFAATGFTLPNTRRAFGGAKVGDKYYLIGGMTDNFKLVEPCDVFDFSNKTWSSMPSPARPRISPEVVVLGTSIFVAGGMSPKVDGSGLEPNTTLEVFCTKDQVWSVVPTEMPRSVRHMSMSEFRGQLLLFSFHNQEANACELMLINPYNASGKL